MVLCLYSTISRFGGLTVKKIYKSLVLVTSGIPFACVKLVFFSLL